VDQQRTTPGRKSGVVGVTVLTLLIAAAVVLLVITQRQHQPAASFQIGAPFPAPCSDGGDIYHCYDIRITNVGDLAGTVTCTVTDTTAGVVSFVNDEHTYRSAPIEPDREVFVILQVDDAPGTDPGTVPVPNASCALDPPG
jgi:hypothetical protein